MSLIEWLLGKKKLSQTNLTGFIKGTGAFDTEVVGESFYQDNLGKICGKRSRSGERKAVIASLICDDKNPKDDQAVRIEVEGFTVGHLSRADAREYRKELKKLNHGNITLTCNALIVGGWKRGDDVGHYGVKLDVPA